MKPSRGRSITLYLDRDVEEAVQKRMFAPASRSEVINTMLRRYAVGIQKSPDSGLTQAEWSFLTDCLRESWLTTHPLTSPETSILVRVIDAVRDERHQPYDVNGPELVAKIQQLSTAQAIGILDRLETSWTALEGSQVRPGRKAKAR